MRKRSGGARAPMPKLVPIVLKTPGREDGAVAVEVRIGSDVVVSLPASVEARWLGTLLRTVIAC